MAKYLILALVATILTCMAAGYAIKIDALPAAFVAGGFGTYIVFTLGRLSGMQEITTEIMKGQNESAQS